MKHIEIERLMDFIKEYQARVQEAVFLFDKHKNINPIYWRQRGISQVGFIDSARTIKYFFHGIGCQVDLPSGPVDWDFGHNDRHDGFDVWRLCRFAEEGTTNFPDFANQQTLEIAFAEAKAKGIIKQLYKEHHDGHYYFATALKDESL